MTDAIVEDTDAPAPFDLPAQHPNTPVIVGLSTVYGVQVSTIGDDGDLVAMGHVGRLRAIAAFNRYAKSVGLYDQSCIGSFEDVESIEYLWMRNNQERADDEGCDWWFETSEPDDVGAFPVTYFTV